MRPVPLCSFNHIDSVTRGPVSPEYATTVIAELKTACFMAYRLDVDYTRMVKYCAQETWLLVDRKDFEDAPWSTVLSNHINSVTRGPVSPEYAPEVIAELKTACFMAYCLDVD